MRSFLVALFLYPLIAFGQFQDSSETEQETFEFISIEEKAMYKGDYTDSLFYQYMQDSLRYPDIALEMNVEGRVYVEFRVNGDSTVTDIRVISPTIGYGLEEEAIRLIQATSGDWHPAMVGRKTVSMKFRVPVSFILD